MKGWFRGLQRRSMSGEVIQMKGLPVRDQRYSC
jgi:hypothetical protein